MIRRILCKLGFHAFKAYKQSHNGKYINYWYTVYYCDHCGKRYVDGGKIKHG